MGSPTVTPLYEQWHNGGYLVSQAPGHLSHDQVTLGQSGLTYAGTVLGQQSIGTTAAAAAALGATGPNFTWMLITQQVSTSAALHTSTVPHRSLAALDKRVV